MLPIKQYEAFVVAQRVMGGGNLVSYHHAANILEDAGALTCAKLLRVFKRNNCNSRLLVDQFRTAWNRFDNESV